MKTAFVLCALFALAAAMLASIGQSALAFDLAVAGSFGASFTLFVAAYLAQGNASHPLCLIALMLAMMYPVHGLLTHGTIEQIAVLGSEGDAYLAYALAAQTTTLPMLWWGYHSAFLRRLWRTLPRLERFVDDDAPETWRKLGVVYVLGQLARVPLLVEGLYLHVNAQNTGATGLESIEFVLKLVAEVPLFVAWYVFAIGLTRRHRGMLAVALAILGIEILWGLLSGSRFKLLWPLIGAVMVATTCWRPLRLTQLVTGLAAFVTLAIPFALSYRTAYSGRLGASSNDGVDTSLVVSSVEDVFGGSDEATSAGDDSFLAERLHGLSSFALVIRFTPERSDYEWGLSYWLVPLQVLVPRVLWPDKPPPSPFAETFRRRYWGVGDDDDTSVAVSQLGDFWVNFHYPGVLVGSFVFGGIIAFLHLGLRLGTDGRSLLPKIVFVALLHSLLGATEVAFAGFLVTLPKVLLIYFLIAMFLARPRSRRFT